MKKIIALNWKQTQTLESAPVLLKTVEDINHIYPDHTWIVFPGDELINTLQTKLPLGTQNVEHGTALPYCLVWHMSQRLSGKSDEEIQRELKSLKDTTTVPILCVGPLHEEDTLEWVMMEQLTVLENWPKEKPIIIAYEPVFAIGTGKAMTLDDIEIVTDILREALKDFTNKSIIYWGSVNDHNIGWILRVTDGVLVGTASQKSSSLLALSIALWQND